MSGSADIDPAFDPRLIDIINTLSLLPITFQTQTRGGGATQTTENQRRAYLVPCHPCTFAHDPLLADRVFGSIHVHPIPRLDVGPGLEQALNYQVMAGRMMGFENLSAEIGVQILILNTVIGLATVLLHHAAHPINERRFEIPGVGAIRSDLRCLKDRTYASPKMVTTGEVKPEHNLPLRHMRLLVRLIAEGRVRLVEDELGIPAVRVSYTRGEREEDEEETQSMDPYSVITGVLEQVGLSSLSRHGRGDYPLITRQILRYMVHDRVDHSFITNYEAYLLLRVTLHPDLRSQASSSSRSPPAVPHYLFEISSLILREGQATIYRPWLHPAGLMICLAFLREGRDPVLPHAIDVPARTRRGGSGAGRGGGRVRVRRRTSGEQERNGQGGILGSLWRTVTGMGSGSGPRDGEGSDGMEVEKESESEEGETDEDGEEEGMVSDEDGDEGMDEMSAIGPGLGGEMMVRSRLHPRRSAH